MTLVRRQRAANEPPAVRKIIQNRGHFPSDEAVIKPLRISEIGLASGCVGPTATVTPSLALLLLRRAAKWREVAGAVPVTGPLAGSSEAPAPLSYAVSQHMS